MAEAVLQLSPEIACSMPSGQQLAHMARAAA
jgi:hypothetical protein